MESAFKNQRLEKFLTGAIFAACVMTALSFALLLGFEMTRVSRTALYLIQILALFIFVGERFFCLFAASSHSAYIKTHWLGFALIAILILILLTASVFGENANFVRYYAISIYLLLQIVAQISNIAADAAAAGKNPAKFIVSSFLFFIIVGTIFLMLPKSTVDGRIHVIDAVFTATSAVCLTGLTVKDTAAFFSHRGHLVILALIQFGAVGIMIFGAVFALIIRQTWGSSERIAIRDMLSMEARSRLGKTMLFIFGSTAIIEFIGAMCLIKAWQPESGHGVLFLSIFHSISAFCNSGFTLFSDSFQNQRSGTSYLILMLLIFLGGLGFSVLNDLTRTSFDFIKRSFRRRFNNNIVLETPLKRLELQTRIILAVSLILIVLGAIGLFIFENVLPVQATELSSGQAGVSQRFFGFFDSIFQSVTARTAGFSTVDIGSLSAPSLFILILLMLVGGSPGSAAGGIKTVTVAIIVMTALATLRKRSDVEIFNRSVPLIAVGRSIMIVLLFLFVLFSVTLLLCITERSSNFTMGQLFFETASALSASGLSTGITASLTTAGKLLIILLMLIGRLGPLTLLTG